MLEETGFECELGERAARGPLHGPARPAEDRPLLADAVTGGEFAANDEVDAIRWLDSGEAAELLSYEHDRRLVQGLAYGR